MIHKLDGLLSLNAVIPLLGALFVLWIFIKIIFAIYNNFIYPLRQSFKKKNESGYVLSSNGNYEHREIVETIIQRKLKPGEEVHHINGKKWDNRKSNLALMTRQEHQRWHQRLEWMWEQRMRPSIRWQRMKLQSEFGAVLF